MSFRPMPILTGLSLISLFILFQLGNWQHARYTEKQAAPPLEAAVADASNLSILIQPSSAAGVQQVYGLANSEPIWRYYTLGMVEETGEPVLALVDATGGANPVAVEYSELPERIQYRGTLSEKSSKKGLFGNPDRPRENVWYRLDARALADRFDVSMTPRVAEPIELKVRNSADLDQFRITANPYAFAKPLDPLPPERHFGYALTWWGMALGLIGVYVALHHSRGRLRFRKV